MAKIVDYKNTLMELIWKNQSIKDIMEERMNLTELSYSQFCKYVKKYAKDPNTIVDKGIYFLFEVEPTKVLSSATMRYSISIWVIVSDDIAETDDGKVITDVLVGELDKMLNENKSFGIGPLELSSAPTFSTPSGFYGRCVNYIFPDFNVRRTT